MRKSKFTNDKERAEYRKKYKAEWFQKKYREDPEWKDRHRRRNKRRVKELTPEEKKERSIKQLKYHKKRMGQMDGKEKRQFSDQRKVYLKRRRDERLVPENREKYRDMEDYKKIAFLEKLCRYQKLYEEFEPEMQEFNL